MQFCVIMLYNHIQIYAEHKHNNELQWTNEYTTNKNISLTLYSRLGDVSCVWEMSWRRRQTAILTPSSSSTIAALLSHLDWVAQPWVTEGSKTLSLQAGSHTGILSPSDSNRPGHLVIFLFNVHLLPLFFRLFIQVHLLTDSSVEGQYITITRTLLLGRSLLLQQGYSKPRWKAARYRSLTSRCSVVSYQGYPFFWSWGHTPLKKIKSVYRKPHRRRFSNMKKVLNKFLT